MSFSFTLLFCLILHFFGKSVTKTVVSVSGAEEDPLLARYGKSSNDYDNDTGLPHGHQIIMPYRKSKKKEKTNFDYSV